MSDWTQMLDAAISKSRPDSKLGRIRLAGVRKTEEFRRIVDLPRRVWSEQEAQELADILTQCLRTKRGEMSLRPTQAVALAEIGIRRGLLGPIRVGEGKTLITLLAPYVIDAKRPLLILPAKLIEKTRRDQKHLSRHWRIPYWIHVRSYESLGRVSHATYLERLKPDVIICDEVHFVKNPKAAVTRRLRRYVEKVKPPFVGLSGTITSHSLLDFGHLAKWALWDSTPLPVPWAELQDWANAIDHRTLFQIRSAPGVLSEFANGSHELDRVRDGVRARIVETPGVVATSGEGVECSLRINRVTYESPSVVVAAFETLRRDWETPDGWALIGGLDVYRHACQLALGFYYRWNPRPPLEWMRARKEWASFVREKLANNRQGLDSPFAIAQACAKGVLSDEAYKPWVAIRDTFRPHTEAVWLSDHALQAGQAWLAEHKSGAIAFVSHVEFAERLSKLSGVPYCGQQGIDASGKYIENYCGETLIASLGSNKEGRNLQTHWSSALVCSPPGTGQTWEQLLGRLHRPGQEADEVVFDVWSLCAENDSSFALSREKAQYIGQTTGQIQKLQYADIVWDVPQKEGALWNK